MATNTKKTPAYVEKAIKWLEKNAPDNEQIAFISDEEAALLKARGGSGEEVVDGVKSYQKSEGVDTAWGGTPASTAPAPPSGPTHGMIGDHSGGGGGFPGGVGHGGGYDRSDIARQQTDRANMEFINRL